MRALVRNCDATEMAGPYEEVLPGEAPCWALAVRLVGRVRLHPFDQASGRLLGDGAPPVRLVREGSMLRAALAIPGADVVVRGERLGPAGAPVASGDLVVVAGQPYTLLRGARRPDGPTRWGIRELLAVGDDMLAVLCDVSLMAASNAAVLVHGESGTGKELVARLLHDLSPRQRGPFVAVNCAALPDTLADAELFGHQRGAFTGATEARSGLVEEAAGGTLFLDEVGELSPAVQAKLLRTLESGEVRRLGSRERQRVDVRVVSATHRDLASDVELGRFRADLLYRLDVLSVVLPPLRSRPQDIPALCEALLCRWGQLVRVDAAALDRLRSHAWPGNVRELRNVLQRASVYALGGRILPEHVELAEPRVLGTPRASAPPSLCALRDRRIREELERQSGHRRRTYEALGMPRSTFYRWLRRQADPSAPCAGKTTD